MQEALSDWDKFNAVAEQAAAKGYKMLSGYDDSYRTFSNNVSAPWVTGTTVTVDENLMKWVEQTKTYTDNGYNNKSSLWSDVWAADQGPDGKVFGLSLIHISEPTRLGMISYAVFCLKKKNIKPLYLLLHQPENINHKEINY